MTHPDRELLTQLALDDPLALDADSLVHIADCEQCSAEVAALQRVVAASESIRDDPSLREVIAPPDRVWDRIALSAGAPAAGDRMTGGSPTSQMPRPADGSDDWMFGAEGADESHVETVQQPAHSHTGARRSRRRTGVQILAAAAVGVIVGALFTWVLTGRDDDPGGDGSGDGDTTFTTSDLVGIDGHTTSGVASFSQTSTGGEVTIELQPESVGDGFIQAWLLDEDTGGMVALGVIDGDAGTFAVPADLDLTAFNQIDISLEPYDGNPEHSAVSLARGPLP